MIDWAGEFNSYLVPFAPFGAAAISRTLQPQLPEYLYSLSASDGADPTRYVDTGTGQLRNGEPEGELGVVRQSDFAWRDQTGAPDDPQPGNIPGGARDVLRSASFNNGTADGFAPDSGAWSVSKGRYEVAPTVLGGDAVSVFYVDAYKPLYYEIQATINAWKPLAGYRANAYVVFDYQGPTDFKFVGVNISTNKMEMGHRDATGWITDVQANLQVRSDTDYNLLVAINGVTATLLVNNAKVFSYAYAPRVIDGYSYGLNTGMVGLGANNAKARIDNAAVQVLPPAITFSSTDDFSDGVADLFTASSVGNWLASGGRYSGSPIAGADLAAWTFDLRLRTSSLLLMDATLSTQAYGGFVFDYYDPQNFKYAMIVAGQNLVARPRAAVVPPIRQP